MKKTNGSMRSKGKRERRSRRDRNKTGCRIGGDRRMQLEVEGGKTGRGKRRTS